jgi:pantoate--beta-alanine ligase
MMAVRRTKTALAAKTALRGKTVRGETSVHRMKTVRGVAAVRRQVRSWRASGGTVAFVPTMGSLHEGHLSLIRRGQRFCDRTVVSIFVNPTQFGPQEDFTHYPRNLRQDLKLARELSVDLCFTPHVETLYPPGHRTEIHVTGLEGRLEGVARPTHFAGVALVVQKLLHIVEPDVLVLGQKDAQQAVILERMIQDLNQPVKVVRGPTVREKDGLALSSRNVYLDPRQRQAAPVLWRALRRARAAVRGGERSAARVLGLIRREIATEPLVRLDYAAVVEARSLENLSRLRGRVLIPLAAYVGRTRLIDNIEFRVPGGRS